MKGRLATVLSRMERFRLTRLDPGHFGNDQEWSLEDEDISGTLVTHRPPPLLFGKYSAERVLADFERWDILPRIRALGYRDLRAEFGGGDQFETRFCLLASHPDADGPCMLMDIRTHQGEFCAVGPFDDEEMRVRALILDWISLQDAARPLPPDRLPLPGQAHPGLGIFRKCYRVTLGYLRGTDFDVVVNVPEHFHNAVLYSRDFKFFMPHREGHFQAMKRDLLTGGLSRASHALSAEDDFPDRVQMREGRAIIRWTPAEQILALSTDMRDYFYDSRYRKAVERAKEGSHYRLIRDDAHSRDGEE